jgi:hypothetical protein
MSTENKIEFYFLRASAEKFATDLRHFAQYASSFSDEQLLAIVSYCDHMRDNMANVKKELEKRVNQNS